MITILVKIIEKVKYFYGRAFIKSLTKKLGKYISGDISYPIYIKSPKNIFIGERTRIGPRCLLGGFDQIHIGNDVIISSDCILETGYLKLHNKNFGEKHFGKKILISNNVWLGTRSIVLAGVTIGENSFVAAGSIITKDVPSNSIYKNGRVFKRKIKNDE